MANVNDGSPITSKKHLLIAVINYILRCGYEIWTNTLKIETYRKRMASIQKRSAQNTSIGQSQSRQSRIIRGYSHRYLVQKRKREKNWNWREAAKKEVSTCRYWEDLKHFNREKKGRRTAKFIDLYITQFSTMYIILISTPKNGKGTKRSCRYDDSPHDNPLHMFLNWSRWMRERRRLESAKCQLIDSCTIWQRSTSSDVQTYVIDAMLCFRILD